MRYIVTWLDLTITVNIILTSYNQKRTYRPVPYFDNFVNPSLVRPPLNLNGDKAKPGFTFKAKQATDQFVAVLIHRFAISLCPRVHRTVYFGILNTQVPNASCYQQISHERCCVACPSPSACSGIMFIQIHTLEKKRVLLHIESIGCCITNGLYSSCNQNHNYHMIYAKL